MSDLATLRAAAALMREHANAALDDLDSNAYWGDRGDWENGVEGGLGGPAGAFCAAWHPMTALAVATWLDAEAVVLGERQPFIELINAAVTHASGVETTFTFGRRDDGTPAMEFDTAPSALAVAHAYLGRQA